MRLLRLKWASMLLLLAWIPYSSARAQDAISKVKFKSSNGFYASYPGTWFRKGTSKNRLELTSSKGGAEGMVVKKNQGDISVVNEQNAESLKQLIERYSQGIQILDQKTLAISRNRGNSCHAVREVMGTEPSVTLQDVPKAPSNLVRTMYFCQIGNENFVAILTNVESDKNQISYQKVALEIVRSIRVFN